MTTETQYEITETEKTVYGQSFATYGIKGKSVSFDDISTDRNKVLEMVKRMNREGLEEGQFMYFIEDELIR